MKEALKVRRRLNRSLMRAEIKKLLLDRMPENGTGIRRLRRWNIQHDFLVSKLFWTMVLILGIAYGLTRL